MTYFSLEEVTIMQEELIFFTNDYFKLLQILKREERVVNNTAFSPLLYKEIAEQMNCSRQTVGKYIQILKEHEYVIPLTRGRLQLTQKSYDVLERLQSEV